MTPNSSILFDNLPEGVFLLDAAGHILSYNQAACRITGYAPAEIENKPFFILDDDQEDTIKFQYELNMAVQDGKWVSEGWRRRKDKTRYWAEATISPVFGDDNRLSGFTVLLRDTTERKNRWLETKASEERFRLMVEAVKDYSIFMLDPEGYILTWNEGVQLIHGYSASELIGKHFSIFYTSADLIADKAENELRIARQQGIYREEGWRVKKGGSVFWASVVLTALFNDQNKLIGFSKVTRDLTSRLREEEVLRDSEARYRSLVEQVADYGIFMLDEKGRIVSWNEGAKRIKGYAADEVIGKYFSIFYPEEDIINDKPKRELRIARAVGKYEEEGWRLRKDGTRFWANIVITAVYDQENRLTGFSKVTRDLTERKLGEQALQESSNRYRQLASELSLANDELSAANKELEQFSAIVSHDLKEPVRTVKSFLHLMARNVEQDQFQNIKTYIGKGIAAAERMEELINNLLDYSHISKSDLIKEEVKVADLFHAAVQNLNDSVEASGAKVTFQSDVESVRGDRVQLVQLFQNLLGNALKFTKNRAPIISVQCSEENNRVRFMITDNGIGIPPEKLEAVFEIFRRLHFASEYPGTGVGLAICKKVVERHNGKIWAESVEGNGTTFFVVLPHNH
ncbi:PAS domain-containing sensor histidine kinase [Dyadobacter sp.]|uniref:PAS domain-containing sensor histidine kinase n=1 Tax=Dyadobacter sp. TaxID=1914288 RepID=UPI003F6E46A0